MHDAPLLVAPFGMLGQGIKAQHLQLPCRPYWYYSFDVTAIYVGSCACKAWQHTKWCSFLSILAEGMNVG